MNDIFPLFKSLYRTLMKNACALLFYIYIYVLLLLETLLKNYNYYMLLQVLLKA